MTDAAQTTSNDALSQTVSHYKYYPDTLTPALSATITGSRPHEFGTADSPAGGNVFSGKDVLSQTTTYRTFGMMAKWAIARA